MKLFLYLLFCPLLLLGQQNPFVESQWKLADEYHRSGDRVKTIEIYHYVLDSLLKDSVVSNLEPIASTYNRLGGRLQNYGNWDKSALAYTNGLLLLDTYNEHDSLKADLTLHLGLLYLKLLDPSHKYYLDRAEELAIKSSNNRALYLIYKAIKQYDKGINLSKSINNNQYLSNFYYLKGRADYDFKLYFDSARMVLPKQVDAPLQNFQYHLYIIDYFLEHNELDSALFHCKKAEFFAPYMNDDEVDLDYLTKYSDLYLKSKDYKKAYEYKSSADSINAKLNSSKNRSVLADLEKQRSVYQEKNEVIRLRSAQQKQILLILVFITITTILIFFFFRTKRLNNKLAKSLVSNQTLFTILSHDFRVPLLSIKRIVDSNEDIRNSKNKLQGSVNSILTEFDNLLSWSASQLNRINPKPVNVDLALLIEENIKLNKSLVESKNTKIVLNYKKDCGAFADENMINICINNVLSNAFKYCPSNSDIYIEVVEGLNTVLKVRNTISPTKIKKGLGLGLTICKDFVITNNGLFVIRESQNTFYVEITLLKIRE